MPAPFNDITATYTSAHAWMYETVVAPAVYGSRHVIDERFLPHLKQDARILDVGSGGGLFTKYIADLRPDIHIVGVDLSKPQIARASKRMRNYADRVRFELGDAMRLAFADRTFDGVISYGSVARQLIRRVRTRPQSRGPVADHRSRSQHQLRRRRTVHRELHNAALSRRHQSRNLPHLDRRAFHRSGRRA
jgi:SAM-dependent methyltransferase